MARGEQETVVQRSTKSEANKAWMETQDTASKTHCILRNTPLEEVRRGNHQPRAHPTEDMGNRQRAANLHMSGTGGIYWHYLAGESVYLG